MCIYIIKNKNINDFHPYNFVQYFVNSRLSVYSKCDSLLEKNEDLKEKKYIHEEFLLYGSVFVYSCILRYL